MLVHPLGTRVLKLAAGEAPRQHRGRPQAGGRCRQAVHGESPIAASHPDRRSPIRIGSGSGLDREPSPAEVDAQTRSCASSRST